MHNIFIDIFPRCLEFIANDARLFKQELNETSFLSLKMLKLNSLMCILNYAARHMKIAVVYITISLSFMNAYSKSKRSQRTVQSTRLSHGSRYTVPIIIIQQPYHYIFILKITGTDIMLRIRALVFLK